MHLITDDYREMNRALHGAGHYGRWGDKWADEVRELIEETHAKSVLDYGCGAGTLGRSLADLDVEWHDYDPAIAGKEDKPQQADLVVCTDVIEHIEPDLLDNVLADIARIATKAVFLVIATRPAKKTLPDGRNAHLILENAAWWRKKLDARFYVSRWEDRGGEIAVVAGPVYKMGQIEGKSAVSDTLRYENALRNIGRVPGRVAWGPRHDGRCVLAAYGPSLKHTWHGIRAEQRLHDAVVVSMSGSHDFLIERGIVPDIHVEVDPREHKAHFTRNPHPDVHYMIASCIHPKVIDQLQAADARVSLFHVYNSETDRQIIAPDGPDPDNILIAGCGSVGGRALNMMFERGFRTFSLYGMDCSFDPAGEQHAGFHSGKKQAECAARVGDRYYRTSLTLIYTARGFLENFNALRRASEARSDPFIPGTEDRVEIFLHGDGLLQDMAYRSQPDAETAA